LIRKFSLSYSTASRRLEDMRCNIEGESIKRIKSSHGLALQVEGSTDAADLPALPASKAYIQSSRQRENAYHSCYRRRHFQFISER
jgi:hypothetical protein